MYTVYGYRVPDLQLSTARPACHWSDRFFADVDCIQTSDEWIETVAADADTDADA